MEEDAKLLMDVAKAFKDTTGIGAELEPVRDLFGHNFEVRLKVIDERRTWQFPAQITRSIDAVLAHLQLSARPVVLITEHVTPMQAERLQGLGISFLDSAGNAFLKQGALFVLVTGRSLLKRSSRPSRLFRSSGMRAVFHFLCFSGSENLPYRGITTAVGLSLGAISWIMSDLKQAGHLVLLGTGDRRLVRKRELLERWVGAWPDGYRSRLSLGRFDAPQGEPLSQLRQLPDAWVSGELAATELGCHQSPASVSIYTAMPAMEFAALHQLSPAPRSGCIELLRAFWSPRARFTPEHLAPPLLIYGDLLATRNDSALKAAACIYEKYLVPLIGEG